MSTTRTLTLANRIDGVLTDLDELPVLRDPDDTYGVRRADTLAVIVAAGAEWTRESEGRYSYLVEGLVAGVAYEAYVEFVYGGETSREPYNWTQAADADAVSYCTLAEGDAIAAALPGLASYKAADADARAAALVLASMDLDDGGPWQGRRYDLSADQVLEFPRIPYPSSCVIDGQWGVVSGQVWDWDADNNVAVVPAQVKQACVFQADAILEGTLAAALADQAAGIASHSAGSVSVSYRDPAAVAAAVGGGLGQLGVRAAARMKKYRLKGGQIL